MVICDMAISVVPILWVNSNIKAIKKFVDGINKFSNCYNFFPLSKQQCLVYTVTQDLYMMHAVNFMAKRNPSPYLCS